MNIIFMGRKSYAAEMLEWTVGQGICVKAVCTDSQYSNSLTMLKAQHLGLPVISMEESEQYVEEHAGEIDLIVSYLYWRKIRKPLIEGPRYGCINFHPAILPDWRGCGGYNIAILNKLQSGALQSITWMKKLIRDLLSEFSNSASIIGWKQLIHWKRKHSIYRWICIRA